MFKDDFSDIIFFRFCSIFFSYFNFSVFFLTCFPTFFLFSLYKFTKCQKKNFPTKMYNFCVQSEILDLRGFHDSSLCCIEVPVYPSVNISTNIAFRILHFALLSDQGGNSDGGPVLRLGLVPRARNQAGLQLPVIIYLLTLSATSMV